MSNNTGLEKMKSKRRQRLKKGKKFISEFRRSKTGMLGLSILVILLFVAIFFPVIGHPEDIDNWSNFQYWQGNPKIAPPCWAARDTFKTILIENPEESSNVIVNKGIVDDYYFKSYTIVFNLDERAPMDIMVSIRATYSNYTYIYLRLDRPDGTSIELTNNPFEERGTSVKSVFGVSSKKFNGTINKNLASYVVSPRTIRSYTIPWLEAHNVTVPESAVSVLSHNGFDVLFREISPNMLKEENYLKGTYNFTITFVSLDKNMDIKLEKVILIGGCYGLTGTDKYGRDLTQGILYGVRWALIIGLLTSLVATLFGGVYGVTSGYFGGVVDELMLRVAQVIYSIPVLPLIILLAAIFRPSIWNLVLILIIFGWPGIALVTRSMSLQLKEETYVEAVRALGAGHLRIMFFYILPQILPYLFASIALSVPGAVLAEAGISFLGLGDPTVLTWGRILNEAQNAGATINGYWWWVIPPGLMITLVGMTFILIGQALDTILNPRLRR